MKNIKFIKKLKSDIENGNKIIFHFIDYLVDKEIITEELCKTYEFSYKEICFELNEHIKNLLNKKININKDLIYSLFEVYSLNIIKTPKYKQQNGFDLFLEDFDNIIGKEEKNWISPKKLLENEGWVANDISDGSGKMFSYDKDKYEEYYKRKKAFYENEGYDLNDLIAVDDKYKNLKNQEPIDNNNYQYYNKPMWVLDRESKDYYNKNLKDDKVKEDFNLNKFLNKLFR